MDFDFLKIKIRGGFKTFPSLILIRIKSTFPF